MAEAVPTIRSKNYSSWSLRGWLLCRTAGFEFVEEVVPVDDPVSRAELSPSILVPCLTYNGIRIWDTPAIPEYVNEVKPRAGLLPKERAVRARCRPICGEMHSGCSNLRSALPMNLKARRLGFKIWSGAQADIDRIMTIGANPLPLLAACGDVAATPRYSRVDVSPAKLSFDALSGASQYTCIANARPSDRPKLWTATEDLRKVRSTA